MSHIKSKTKVKWVQKGGERKVRQVPWSHTPVIRVRADGVRVPRREEVAPRLLTLDEVEDEDEEEGKEEGA